MPYEVQLDHLPAGYALQGGRAGDQVEFAFRGFTSFEDGELFISRLEGVPIDIIRRLPSSAGARPSITDNLFAILRRDRTATVYYNDFRPHVSARAKGKVSKGDPVMLDNILDMDRVILEDFHIPEDAGVCYVFSLGWRKGYWFDFGPLLEGKDYRARDYDLGIVIAECYARVWFQHLYSISEAVWEEMLRQHWFPFAYLPTERVKRMIGRAAEKLPIDDELNEIHKETLTAARDRVPEWSSDPVLSSHVPFFRTAVERFEAGDDISATSILYPRLEGLMRSYHLSLRTDEPTQAKLITVASGEAHPVFREFSLLLPARFRRYLRDVYFASFDPKKPGATISRHTVSHGVAPAELFDRKAATLGFLILLQISSVIRATAKSP